ncbi:hypothetical protein HAN_1g96 (nucleomorph) [Hemiselmis andersenii]|uniref:Plus3 domain-containing protein n=1 Tax=Hemiselmis andersenii TaxID=464988 RepID=A9BKA5_HEMAN|nr:hypothetical protein HAN_1g96 [Hemiselmis andersenii]ABW97938.1 hypothetical protein HAN_1g96 [Hemiselmis andersenii]
MKFSSCIIFFKWLNKIKKFIINRSEIKKILKKSEFTNNLKGYFCRVALDKEFLKFNRYSFAKISKYVYQKNKIKFSNYHFVKMLLLKINNELKLFPIHVISNKFPKFHEIQKFFFFKKKKKLFKKLIFFLKYKKNYVEKNNKVFKIKIRLSRVFF